MDKVKDAQTGGRRITAEKLDRSLAILRGLALAIVVVKVLKVIQGLDEPVQELTGRKCCLLGDPFLQPVEELEQLGHPSALGGAEG